MTNVFDGIDVAATEKFSARRLATLPPAPLEETLFDRAVVAAWKTHQMGFPLSIETLQDQDSSLPTTQLADLVATPLFQEALAERGIPNPGTVVGITAEQLFALQVMSDPSLQTPIMTRLRRLNIPYPKWQGWLRQAPFAAAYLRLRETILTDQVGPTLSALAAKAASGDVPAAKLHLELVGRYVPGGVKNTESRNYDAIIRVLSEAIQTYVSDPAAIEAIGKALEAASRQEGLESDMQIVPVTSSNVTQLLPAPSPTDPDGPEAA